MNNQTNRKYKLLFVDDEPRITMALKAIFRREYEVFTANSGTEALTLLETEQPDIIVSDERMPNMLGHEFLSQVSMLYPQTMRILLTGFMDKEAIVNSINHGEIYRYINKPWKNDEIKEVIAEAALASEIPIEPSVPVVQDTVEKTTDRLSEQNNSTHKSSNESNTLPADSAIMVLDQEQSTRNQIRKFCSSNKITIYAPQTGRDAVITALLRKNIGIAIIALPSDTRPTLQTINLLKQKRPDLITIVLTDELDAETAVDLINQGQAFRYLAKPFDQKKVEPVMISAFRRHLFLKRNSAAQTRFKVTNPVGKIVKSLQDLFKANQYEQLS